MKKKGWGHAKRDTFFYNGYGLRIVPYGFKKGIINTIIGMETQQRERAFVKMEI